MRKNSFKRNSALVGVVFVTASVLFSAVYVMHPNLAYAAGNITARWKFDETVAGTTAADYVGSNHGIPGTQDVLYPTPSTDVAPVNFTNPRSAGFNGDNYFTIDNPVSTDFTICAWVKTSSTGGGVDHWTSAPIMDAEWGGVNYDFGFGIGNGGKLMFGNGGDPVGGGGIFDAQVNGATSINDNQWHNVCVTRNNTTGLVRLYVDAQLDGEGVTGVGALTVRSQARIGWGFDGAALFQGLIDDVRVYDVDLTQEEIQRLTDGVDDPFADDQPALAENAAATAGPTLANTGTGITSVALPSLSLIGVSAAFLAINRRREALKNIVVVSEEEKK